MSEVQSRKGFFSKGEELFDLFEAGKGGGEEGRKEDTIHTRKTTSFLTSKETEIQEHSIHLDQGKKKHEGGTKNQPHASSITQEREGTFPNDYVVIERGT